MPVSDAALQEYYDKHYHQLLPLIDEKVHQEKTQQDKLKEVKARLNFEGWIPRGAVFTRLGGKEKGVFNRMKGKERSVYARSSDSRTQRHRNFQREAESRYKSSRSRKAKPIPRKRYHKEASSQRTEAFSKSEDSGGGH
ncbi:hypothetical protein Tco_1436823 [Tanacetum coccineum]